MTTLSALASPPILRTFVSSFVARLPLTVIGVLVLLRSRELGFSYALAGMTSGAFALGMALGSPLMGRLVDRLGQSTVLCVSCLIAAAAISALALTPAHLPILMIGLAALIGVTQPPVSACVRVLWARVLNERDRDAMFAVDVSVQGIAYIVGPMTMLWLAATAGAPVALHATGLLLVVATLAFALDPVTRAPAGSVRPQARSGPGAIAHSGVRTIAGITMTLGVAFGSVEVGVVAAAEHHDSVSLILLLTCWAIGSVIGGPLWALRRHANNHIRDARVLLIAVALAAAALAIPLPAWWLMPALAIFGALMTPMLTLLYTLMASTSPEGVLTEAYSWEVAGMTGGVALGTSIGGIAVDLGGLAGTFGLATGAIIVGSVILAFCSSTIRGAARTPVAPETTSPIMTSDV
ncbi:hypothetical protein DBV08_15280 [Rhodococcus sp. KBW08]|uniref:MFS transporter n=1 Tax=Rhodococcus sp. KBW08 TaxID=2144188 RepID=UPI000F5A6689|nr:MFS transporter [Rhodococcus sp. KBW08]RQO46836.1 hypothetical protein DBV08_15280 [Rhodococcus sp. KBW08]